MSKRPNYEPLPNVEDHWINPSPEAHQLAEDLEEELQVPEERRGSMFAHGMIEHALQHAYLSGRRLSRRDEFAGMAMTALVTRATQDSETYGVSLTRDDLAHEAVRQADALIDALAALDSETP